MCKPVWALAHVLQQCGVPCAELIAKMLSKCGKQPDTPTTAMYLYGTPNESGSIGLRSGDTVTYYDGIVCSEIPSTPEGHTYAYIFRKLSNDRISARYFSHPLYQKEDYIYCERDVGSTLRGSNYDPNTNSWSEPVWWSHSSNSHQEFPDDYRFDFYACLWANTDIASDDGSVYLAASEPIQVGEIVDYINDIPIYEVIKNV